MGRAGFRRGQGRNRLAQPLVNGPGQGGDGLFGVLAGGGEAQGLAPARTQSDYPGQAGGRYRRAVALQEPDSDAGVVAAGLLDQVLGGAGVQPRVVKQGHRRRDRRPGFPRHSGQPCLGVQTVHGGVAGQDVVDPFQQLVGRIPGCRQTEHALKPGCRCCRSGQGQGRMPGPLGVMAQPEPPAQIDGVLLGDPGQEAGVDAVQAMQTGGGHQGEFGGAGGRDAEAQGLAVALRGNGGAGKTGRQVAGIGDSGQGVRQAGGVENAGEMAQDVQVLVRLGGNGHQHVHPGAIMPGDAVGKLQHADAGRHHRAPAFGGAMGDGDAMAENRGRLPLPGHHAIKVVGGGIAGLFQVPGGLCQCFLPVCGPGTQSNVVGGQRQHVGRLALLF